MKPSALRRAAAALAMTAAATAATAEPDWKNAMLSGSLGRDCPFFAPGEEIELSIRLEGAAGEIPEGVYFVDWERRGDDGVVEKGRAPLPAADAPLVVRTRSEKPGFICFEANVVTADGKRVRKNHRWEPRVFFMGGAAVAPESLEPGPEPGDYDDFWGRQLAQLDAVPVEAELRPFDSPDPAVKLFAFKVACAGPAPVCGWLTMPADASATKRYPLEASWRGASKDDQPPPARPPRDRIRLEANANGFEVGRGADYVKQFISSIEKPGCYYGFDPESNETREGSYWLGMALRAARLLQWATTLPEWDGETLDAAAGSQGGWQALMGAALVPVATKISTTVTWGCDWTGQAAYGRMPSIFRPKCWYPAMAYFDPVFAARRVRCPVEIASAGLGDYVSPPSSLAVLYNALQVPKKIVWRQGCTHGWHPSGMASWTVDGGFDEAMAARARSLAPAEHDDGALAAKPEN